MRNHSISPQEIRLQARRRQWAGPTVGAATGYVQANLVVLPTAWAYDFLLFCQRNPKPCPLLEVTETGSPMLRELAPGADLRTDLPRYRVYRQGAFETDVTDIGGLWQDDFVGFLLGCSLSFEGALLDAGVPMRHLEENKVVPVYVTEIPCQDAGRFHGPLVVSMRPIPGPLVAKAVEVTARYPRFHGAPVHVGDPEAIGIADLSRPAYGESVTIGPGEVPVFWACGVTPQAVAMQTKPALMITHAPNHMFVSDRRAEELSVP